MRNARLTLVKWVIIGAATLAVLANIAAVYADSVFYP